MPQMRAPEVSILVACSETLRGEYGALDIWPDRPFDANSWVLPTEVIMEQWRNGEIASLHGGSTDRYTAQIHVNPDSVHNWLQE